MSEPINIVWFRNDLRLHDHEPLARALQAGRPVLPVYIFDPKLNERSRFGFPRLGPFRARFITEALDDLSARLASLRLPLIFREGSPAEQLAALADETGARAVYFHEECATEEQDEERALAGRLKQLGVAVESFWGNTLYRKEQLPFPLSQTPMVFTNFRNFVERNTLASPALKPPLSPSTGPEVLLGEKPYWFKALAAKAETDERSAFPFRGGETAALERLQAYIWERGLLKTYKKTRNGLLGTDYSSKLSPWLAAGCISPRRINDEVERFEREAVKNESTYWLKFELIWRDYFRFLLARFGSAFFKPSGIIGAAIEWKTDERLLDLWLEGRTGFPMVDANMREIAATGFMSNRGRQIVASFLTKSLGLDWRAGAEYFESLLLDYDPASNYGNWNYAAGVGTDPRGYRFFHPVKQSEKYDPDGEYVRAWLPELRGAPGKLALAPWELSAAQQQQFRCVVGKDYPSRAVNLGDSLRANEIEWKKGLQKSGIRFDRNSLVSKFVK